MISSGRMPVIFVDIASQNISSSEGSFYNFLVDLLLENSVISPGEVE